MLNKKYVVTNLKFIYLCPQKLNISRSSHIKLSLDNIYFLWIQPT